jgi:hypothetical protein
MSPTPTPIPPYDDTIAPWRSSPAFRVARALFSARVALAFLAALGGRATAARTDQSSFAVPAFYVAKSENKNRVVYAAIVDAACAPLGTRPLAVFWRMLERGPSATEPLLAREEPGYGVGEARVVARTDVSGAIRIALRALPDHPVTIETFRDAAGTCRATATTTIAGARARLDHVYLELGWPFGLKAIVLRGTRIEGGTGPIEERVAR